MLKEKQGLKLIGNLLAFIENQNVPTNRKLGVNKII
jgi:hypothetical protein